MRYNFPVEAFGLGQTDAGKDSELVLRYRLPGKDENKPFRGSMEEAVRRVELRMTSLVWITKLLW